MARYGQEYGRDFDRWGGTNRGFGGGWGAQGGGYGGMRSDGWGSNWGNFPGEEGWYGQGYEGYPGGGYGGGYDIGYRGRGFEDWGARPRGGGGYYRGAGGAYGADLGGGYEYGGYGGGGYGGAGYGGRDLGYGGTTRDIGERGGWRRGGRTQTRASEIMTENPETVTPDATLTDVARKMKELNVGIIPVVDSQDSRRLRGVITDRDIAIRAIAEGKDGKIKVSECMTTDIETVNKNDSVDDVLQVMQREQVRRVPVTDREGRLVGIIAQADLAVDFGGFDEDRELRVEETIERISEPAQPRRGATAMAAGSRSRGRATGGRQSGSRTSAGQGETGTTERANR